MTVPKLMQYFYLSGPTLKHFAVLLSGNILMKSSLNTATRIIQKSKPDTFH